MVRRRPARRDRQRRADDAVPAAHRRPRRRPGVGCACWCGPRRTVLGSLTQAARRASLGIVPVMAWQGCGYVLAGAVAAGAPGELDRGLPPGHEHREPQPERPGLAPAPGSGVGALAVVGLLLLATAALASGLAHGDLLVDRSTQSRPGLTGGRTKSGKEPLGVDDDPGDLAGADDLAVAGVPGGDGEAVQPAVDVRRGGASPRPRRRPGWRPGARADPGADGGLAVGQRRLDRGAGRGLAPGEQPRGAEHRQAARADGRGRVVVGRR